MQTDRERSRPAPQYRFLVERLFPPGRQLWLTMQTWVLRLGSELSSVFTEATLDVKPRYDTGYGGWFVFRGHMEHENPMGLLRWPGKAADGTVAGPRVNSGECDQVASGPGKGSLIAGTRLPAIGLTERRNGASVRRARPKNQHFS
jgi:hypothetical protein